MNRRESLKALGITTVSTGILLDACKTEASKPSSIAKTDTWRYQHGWATGI